MVMERPGMGGTWNWLRRNFWLLALTVMAGAAAGTGASYLLRQLRPLYRAEAVINILPPSGQECDYETRVSLAGKVKSLAMMQMMLDPNLGRRVRETRWFRDVLHEDAAQAAERLDMDLTVVAQRQAPALSISMLAPSTKEAALIATEAANLFVRRQTPPPEPDLVGPKIAVLAKQQGEIEKDLREQESAMKALRQNARDMGVNDLAAPSQADSPLADGKRLSDFENQESEQTASIRQLEKEIERLKQQSEGPTPAQVEQAVARDPLIVSLSQQETALQIQLSGQLTRFGEDHRVVRQTKDQIDEVQGALRQRKLDLTEQLKQADALNLAGAGDKLRVQQERLEQMRRTHDLAQNRQSTLHGLAGQYNQLKEKRDELAEALDQVKAQIAALRATPGRPEMMTLQLAGPAQEPADMVLSRFMPLWVAGGALLGLLIGILLIVVTGSLNDVVQTPSDVRQLLNLPLLGVIPDAGEDRAVSGIDPYHVVRDAPYSLLGEAYRYCRTNLDVVQREGLKTLLIASGSPGDGKTSLACNLAAAFAAKHETVLLIDANLRQPSLHLAFGRSASETGGDQRRMGLTSILTGQCDYQAAVRTTRVEGLDLIYAGPPVTSPAELLAGRRMRSLIEDVAKWYDHVIIDSPPVLLVSDVKVLAGLVDATVLVLNAAATRQGEALRTAGELQNMGGKLVGAVLFDAPALKGGYFRRQFRAYRDYIRPQLAAGSA
jgi:capsular exopolysaccharide synthesis family protein